MDVNIECDLCGFAVAAQETDGPGAENLAQLFTAVHGRHTEAQVNSYIWANGRHPLAGKQTPCHGGDDDA